MGNCLRGNGLRGSYLLGRTAHAADLSAHRSRFNSESMECMTMEFCTTMEFNGSSFLTPFWASGGALKSLLRASWSVLGASLALLRASWEPLGASSGLPGELLERIGALFLGDLGFDHFGDRFWLRKGRPKGGILGAKMDPKSYQNRSRKRR